MKRQFRMPLFLALAGVALGALLRLWSLISAVDAGGLPVMDGSMYVFFAVAAVYLLLSAVLAVRSPGRSGLRSAIEYGPAGYLCATVAAALLLLGAILEFAEALLSGPGFFSAIICLLGVAGGIGCFAAAWARRNRETRLPAAELAPALYLLLKLILNFKGWSTDPIILDYCVSLFGMIFALLSVLRGAAFCLDLGRPRRTLFLSLGAVFFAAAAMMDGFRAARFAAAATFAGVLLWQLPLILSLSRPNSPPSE